jgi:hypothetical protein
MKAEFDCLAVWLFFGETELLKLVSQVEGGIG